MKWGILGTGVIARKFASQLPSSQHGRLVATGSRSLAQAASFASQFGGAAHEGYEALVASPDVEAVYVSLPNHLHHEWTTKALKAGKHVLCEKPFARNVAEAEHMFHVAEAEGRVLAEAFMYRCKPSVMRFIEMLREGVIGDIRMIRSNFTFCRDVQPGDARYEPSMAGGSLMDVGAYCLNLCRAVAGAEPAEIRIMAHMHARGVDDYAAGLLRFPRDVLATFTCGMTVESDRTTFIGGTKGWMSFDFPWLTGESFVLVRGSERETFSVPSPAPLYALEADAFAGAVLNGCEPWTTRADTLGNMRALDALRIQAGVPF